MKIKAAIFDMDGTLVNSLMLWELLWSAFGKRYLNDDSFRPSTEDDKMVRTLTLGDAMNLIHKNYRIGKDGGELLDFANTIFYDFYAKDVKLKGGVKEFLDKLLDNGVKMCIATATDLKLVRVAMQHCNLDKYFLKVFSCGDIGKGKDQPDIYFKTLEFLGEKAEDTVVFEDSLVAIETALKIGMPTVGIYDRFNYGQERIKEISTEYIADGETLLKLNVL